MTTPKRKKTEKPEQEETVPARQRDVLRALAGTVYATDQTGISVEQIQQKPQFNAIPLPTMYRWSTEDRWAEKRREFIRQWQHQIERRIGDQLVRTRLAEMERMQGIYDKATKRLEEGLVQENSWEGVAGVLIRIADLIDRWREKIATHVGTVPSAQTSVAIVDPTAPPSIPAIRPRLTEEEAKIAARSIIKQRREVMRQAALAQSDGSPEKKTKS